jgi:hypothetical protein
MTQEYHGTGRFWCWHNFDSQEFKGPPSFTELLIMKILFTLSLFFLPRIVLAAGGVCEPDASFMTQQVREIMKPLQEDVIRQAKLEMGKYSTDTCSTEKLYTTTSYFGYQTTSKYGVCKDGSTSFVQPSAYGPFGYNGFCGETATANVLNMTCGKKWHPYPEIHTLASDFLPGTSPWALRQTLNYLSPDSNCNEKKWAYYESADSGKDYINSIWSGLQSGSNFVRTRSDGTKKRRSPVMAMVKLEGGKELHWITVVDIVGYDKKKTLSENKDCYAIANQWDDQYSIPCSDLAKMANQTGDIYGGIAGRYVRIKQVD